MILVCYDGSPDAQAAIDEAALLMPGSAATVLCVWEPLLDVMSRSGGLGQVAYLPDFDKVDAAATEQAHTMADEGTAHANAAGLNAQPRVAVQSHTVADTILAEAEAIDAQAIVLGTRGLSGIKSLLLGSVSHAVVQHAHRTVIVVPSADIAAARVEARPTRASPA
jgi:nucleotide-binding universal stress UspA family protein